MREASLSYGAREGGDEERGDPNSGEAARGDGDLERFRLRGAAPFTDEEVERLEELAARIGERSAHLHAGEQELLEWIAEFD